VIRRLSVAWPDGRPFAKRGGAPIRILAVSDQVDPALERASNRERLGVLDAIVGAGDLEPDYLGMLADAFVVPLLFVLGNHDRGLGWREHSHLAPHPLEDAKVHDVAGIPLAGLSWPGRLDDSHRRDEAAAWLQALGLARRTFRRREPLLMLSHVPPLGAGDDPADPYHAGFRAYRWLATRLRPPLWLHGHTTAATARHWLCSVEETTYANVTGAVLVEITAPPSARD
jgi:uncharacterized protein